MALFKIFKGPQGNLGTAASGTDAAHEGYAYFTTDNGKFYIDIVDAAAAEIGVNRIPLSADKADKDDLGNIIKNTYAASLNLAGHTLKLIAKDGTSVLSTITLPDEDTKVTQKIKSDNHDYRVILSYEANDTDNVTNTVNKASNLRYNPSLNKLSTGNMQLTGEIDVTGNATFHNQTQADSLIAGSLLVTGNTNFTQSPTAPTPASTSNDTTVATTEFVKNRIAAGVTGVKGNAESSYRVGNVNLTPANIGALAITGGTLTGTLNISVGSAGYADSLTAGGLNLNNSNIYGLNSIYTADASDNAGEGIHFYRDSTHVDTLWMSGGNIYFVPNRAIGTGTTAANSEKVTRLPASITSGRAVYTDGTTGKLTISATTSTELGYLSGVTSAIQTQLNAKAPLASPALTGTPTAPTAAAGTNTTQIATTEFVTNAVAQGFVANDAMVFKGLIGSNQTITQLPASGYNAGWTYRVADAGTFAGEYCEVGDLLIAINDGPTSGSSVINTDWGKVEHNIDGAVFRGSGASNSSVGSSTQPVYVNASGIVNAINYTIDKSVPSNAVFTDRYVNSATFADDSTNTAASPVKMTLTRAGSDTATVTANIPKVSSSSAGVAPKGAAVSSQSQTTKFLREDGTWATPSYTTNTNTTYTFTDGTDGSFSVTPSGGSAQTVSIGKPAMAGTADVANSVAWSNVTGKPSTYYTLPTAADSTLGGIKTGYSASGKNYAIKVDSNGNAYVNVPWTDNNTTSFTITANATDGLWDLTGTNGTNAVTYALAPYSTKQSSTSFYTAATNPTLTTRLNYDGYFYATKLYSGGAEVLTSHQSLANYKTKQTAVSDPTASNTAIAFIDSISQDANGVITPTKKTVRSASTSQTGVIQITADNANSFLNQLSTGSSTPTDADYYISQYVGGGTTTTTYHRRPMSALWDYIKGKITNGIYWANEKATSSASYKTTPEVAKIKLNGNTSASAASTKNVELVYDATLEVLNFVFS